MKNIFWFRQDLRLEHNPGLIESAKDAAVLPIYILDDINAGKHKMGEASRWWLHHSLKSLSKSLRGKLAFFKGDAKQILIELTKSENIQGVYWNRCYEPWRIQRDTNIKNALKKEGVQANSFNASLLWEPWEIYKKDGDPFKVFTPFYKNGCLSYEPPEKPLGPPKKLNISSTTKGKPLDSLDLLSGKKWENKMSSYWKIGEIGAKERLKQFLKNGLEFYKKGRDFPSHDHVSRLSPHLHFGEISPNTVWYAVKGQNENHTHFRTELAWREFSYYLLYHFPTLPEKNFQKKYDKFQWKTNIKHLRLWKKGQTGIPLVDAGMRELWETGYMHNRLRMVTGSFLVKNLLLHWREGEAWFWDCLLDADLASNSASWQWVAGCGADAAPYFRIFNPTTQGEKFDPKGTYIRRFIPELKDLPIRYLFSPWTAPENVLREAGVKLGTTYPRPIVDLKKSREEALETFKGLKEVS
ncbi:cryptochrome/photolyase family protein [Candidatus Neptunichlamydia sp. REUL1]|uniref:cryptochrome/photolyase family protein n=1 Tax=Candidatus Neptunichlamydia sp. REUL1 TaxID=3064277 RepID=UPI00292DD094|nr:deoxyribodipyrimidine photo-lyase [Candidatus Neptunochlamydia sp. REUL1]